MNNRTSSQRIERQGNLWATCIFGFILLTFFIAVFVYAPDELPEYKQRMLAIASALLAGLFAFFLTGNMGIKKWGVKATGGVGVFVLVLLWWFSPLAPIRVKEHNPIYRVRITVVDPRQIPVEDAEVWSSVGGEPKRVAGGWQFDIPAASRPADGRLTIYAAKKPAFLSGQVDVQLGKDPNPAITIQLKKDTSAFVRGIVLDDSGHSISGARVSVAGYDKEALATDKDGNFNLPVHASKDQQVLLHVEKKGYQPTSQWHPAGDEPVTIILER